MSKWYLRDRGQVLGPFSRDEILDMRDRGTVAAYHEVSTDKRVWTALGESPEFGGGSTRLIIGAVSAVLVLGVALVVGILVSRSGKKDDAAAKAGPGAAAPAEGGAGGSSAGPINFAALSGNEQESVIRDTVGLVVCGLKVTFPDGREWEVPGFSLEPGDKGLKVRFGNPIDLIPAKVPPGFGLTDFGTGSGFLIGPKGQFLTNRHVVEEVRDFMRSANRTALEKALTAKIEPRIWVYFGRDKRFVADLVHVSDKYDFAVLKLDRDGRAYFALASTPTEKIPYLKNLSALGFPGADREILTDKDRADAILRKGVDRGQIDKLFPERAFDFSSRSGEVTNKPFKTRMDENESDAWVLQHSAQIFGGNSGGPLVAKDGTVVGINTWTHKKKQGFNYALTLPQLREALDRHAPGIVWRELKD